MIALSKKQTCESLVRPFCVYEDVCSNHVIMSDLCQLDLFANDK